MVDNHPSVRAKLKGKGVVIDHKSHGYRAVSIIYPTWLVQLAALYTWIGLSLLTINPIATELYYISYLIGSIISAASA